MLQTLSTALLKSASEESSGDLRRTPDIQSPVKDNQMM